MDEPMRGDDDESVLDMSEQTMRPPDKALHQQRIPAWHPILDPVWTIVTYLVLGVILVPTGFKIQSLSDDTVELSLKYDAYDDLDPDCPWNTTGCRITFTAPEDMKPPILIHYELENFHQNHRRYFQSRDPAQLLGRVEGQDKVSADNCSPLNYLGDIQLNPCGFIANTFFNDKIMLVEGVDDLGENLTMIEDGISWKSDRDYMFAQPEGFDYQECDIGDGACDNNTCSCDASEWSCTEPWQDETTGKCYRYFYPNQDTTRYLYQTYPEMISPIEGVTNEHFIVWMRVATLPTFRKLYGYIEQTIPKGTNLTFEINTRFDVRTFEGSKSLIVSTNNIFGGKNEVLGPSFYCVGFFCLAAAAFFGLKHAIRPRRIADPKYLHFKQD